MSACGEEQVCGSSLIMTGGCVVAAHAANADDVTTVGTSVPLVFISFSRKGKVGNQSQVSFYNEIPINERGNSLKYLQQLLVYCYYSSPYRQSSPNQYHVNYDFVFVLPLLHLD